MDYPLPGLEWPFEVACGKDRVFWYPYYDETSRGERGWAYHGVLDGTVECVVYADEIKTRLFDMIPGYEVRQVLIGHTSDCVVARDHRLQRSERVKRWDLDEQKRVYDNHGNVVKS